MSKSRADTMPFGALVLSVNLSGVDLADPALVARVQGALAESGLAPERLMLEVGEHTLMQGLDAALPVLGALREASIALCLDGFGTGASSLRHLVKLPVSGLKIAPAFVADLVNGQTGESGHAIVHALVTMAESVAKSVADGNTFACAQPIEGDDRVAEVARMLSGSTSESALRHARELLGA